MHALNALDLTHKAQLTPLDRATVRQSKITHGIEAEEIYDEMTMLLIVSAFLDEDWKVQGVSRRALTDSTLPSNASATWRSRFESDIALWLAPIQKLADEGEPIQDEKGRAITAAFFIDNRNEKRSFAQEAASLVRSMDLDKPEDNLRFRQIVTYAATHTKNEFRAYLHGDPPPEKTPDPTIVKDLDEAIHALNKLNPDLIIVDYDDEILNRDEFLAHFVESQQKLRVVLLSLHGGSEALVYDRRTMEAARIDNWLREWNSLG